MVNDWGNDPELVATFRAEVEERLASLSSGLLSLETHPRARDQVTALFRDAHTVKGSATMLGLDRVVGVAHLMEDLLGDLRDGRLKVRRDLIDLLLTASDAVGRALPGAVMPVDDADLEPVVAALRLARSGADPVAVPVLPVPAATEEDDDSTRVRDAADSVRIAAHKVYDLIDIVGEAALGARRVEQVADSLLELLAEHARWTKSLRLAARDDALPEQVTLALHRLLGIGDRATAAGAQLRELVEAQLNGVAGVRDGAMGLAMVPLRRVVAAFPRLVREVAAASGKDVVLEIEGDGVELDKQVLDGVADALKHLVINAVDHGCEPPAERVGAGKPATATVRVTARTAGGHVVVEVSEDGRGIDEDAVRRTAVERGLLPPATTLSGPNLLALLCAPEFSTAATVTETSGRGVGLDVVKTSVDELGGSIDVRSEAGRGTAFVLTLPVTLGVMRCLVARLGAERFAIPVTSVVETIGLADAGVTTLAGMPVVTRHGRSLPLLDLGDALGVPGERAPRAALIVRHGDRQLAWSVDRLEGETELVVKDLGSFIRRVPGVSGATIAGDGNVVCLLDLRDVGDRAIGGGALVARPAAVAVVDDRPKARVLVVEDSIGVRELERVILEGAGYSVETAVDGLDGAARLGSDNPADIVISDVEMPGMTGFELTRTIRRTKGWERVPVVIMTSRGGEDDRREGLEAGASAYLFKGEFDQAELVETVRRLVGR
ncbi:MAG: two-component system, chemotaxis family, sensor kinase CheA [Frankiaceae bacterium]|nr:two-component system, chemotaxis family, sensor kinase CheA [Frankiaceae bacterium]